MILNRKLIAGVALALALGAVGCKKKKTDNGPPPEPTEATGGQPTATTPGKTDTAATTPAPSGAKGSITGSVAFAGDAPKLDDIKPDKDPTVCGASIPNESLIVNGNKTVKNVIVHIVSDMKVAGPTTPVMLDQKGCRYTPHVTIAMEGQKIMAHSSDTSIMHNVHSYKGEGDSQQGLDNISQPPGSPDQTLQAPDDNSVLLVKCDVHPWMTSYVLYATNPYAAVTGDDGSFKIEGVPAGKYTVEAWHETMGKKTMEVTVEGDKAAEAKFEYKAGDK